MNPAALTSMVDRIVADRYQVKALIGTGALSAVFMAQDLTEDRMVALKIFDERVSDDERLVARLLATAEQASILQHPNVATVYDWGDDQGPFVVSELCEGGSLGALLGAGQRLTASQALVMTLECARALHHGHEQGLVHAQLNPGNLLFTDDQRLRLADFGLADVLAEAVAATAERAIDNVRYASPEQARGREVSGASDMYSLVLVVNEAVTGEQPPVSETLVGTLMDRAETPATVSSELLGLQGALERCGRVDPTERPEADELTISLLATAETMSRPEALPLVGLAIAGVDSRTDAAPDSADQDEVSVSLDDAELEEEMDFEAAYAASDDSDFNIDALGPLDDVDAFGGDDEDVGDDFGGGADGDEPLDQDLDIPVQSEALSSLDNLAEAEPVFADVPSAEVDLDTPALDVPTAPATSRNVNTAYEEIEDDADDKLPWWPLLLLALLIAGAVAAGVLLTSGFRSAETAVVPNLIGLDADELNAGLAGRGWTVDRLETRVDGSVAGTVVGQDPLAGVELDEGETLTVTVSLGNEMVEIPSDIIGLTVEQAASRLELVGLELGGLTEENSEVLGAGLVVALDEPTSQKPMGEGVSLRVSLGAEDRVVPAEIVGMTIADATGLLTGLRLQAIEEPVFDPAAPIGTVMGSIPQPGAVLPADSQVTLLVSAGPQPVEMPDIIGLSLEDAVDTLEALGLIWVDTEGTPGEDAIGSLPPIGATVEVGTEVIIILNDPPEDEEDADDEG